MKTALCQMDIVWGDREANIAAAERFVARTDARLVVLPEMFTTGFDMEPAPLAEKMNGRTVEWMRVMANQSGKAITGSIIVEQGGKLFNRLLFAMPNGNLHHYDKRHLFSYSGEDRNFSSGNKRLIVEYEGFRILPLICYDLRFPVWSRGSDEFDIIIYVASWPASRIRVWDTLLKARAIENQCYVLGVNRVGQDHSAQYTGHSVAVDYYGNIIHSDTQAVVSSTKDHGKSSIGEFNNISPEEQAAIIEAELELESLRAFRQKFPAWRDSDRYSIDN